MTIGVQTADPVAFCIPRADRELDAARFELNEIFRDLELTRTHANPLTRKAATVVACVMLDMAYPPDDGEDRLSARMTEALSCSNESILRLAARAIENRRFMLSAAQASLRLADAIGENLPHQWHNLDVYSLARELNRRGHAICRGSLPQGAD